MASKFMSVVVAIMTGSALFAQSALAEDKDFDPFWTAFKAAVKKHDNKTIVSMTRCPFLFWGKYMKAPELTKQMDKVIPSDVRACMLKEKPVLNKGCYFASCGERIYTFTKVNGKWLLTDLDAND